MRFFYNDDAEAMRKNASQCSISASWFGAQKKKRTGTGGVKNEVTKGANGEIYETTLETSMKLIQFLERSSSQKSRKLTRGKRDSMVLFCLTPDFFFFERGVEGAKESVLKLLDSFMLGYAPTSTSSSSDISMKLRMTRGLLRSAEGFRPSRRASAAEWLLARLRVETERDLRDDRLMFSWTRDGDDMGTIASLSNGVKADVRRGGSRGAREDRNLRRVKDSAARGRVGGNSGRDDEGAGLGEGKARALSRARRGLHGGHSDHLTDSGTDCLSSNGGDSQRDWSNLAESVVDM
jgi:hypothetical protein